MQAVDDYSVNAKPTFTVYSIYTQGEEFYRVALAFKFYFNRILPKNSLNLVSDYIKQSVLNADNNIDQGAQVSIKQQQDVILKR